LLIKQLTKTKKATSLSLPLLLVVFSHSSLFTCPLSLWQNCGFSVILAFFLLSNAADSHYGKI